MAAWLAAAAWAVVAPSATAADLLVASIPAPRDELSSPPGGVSLAFSKVVKQDLVKVLVLNAAGENAVVGDLLYSGSSVTVQLDNDLPKGTYTVQYQIDRADGQPEGGAYQFAYGKGSWTRIVESWSGTAEQPPEMANPDSLSTEPVATPASSPPLVEVEDPSASPTSTQATPPTSATPAATPTAEPAPAPGSGSPLVWVLGGVVLLAALGGGGWLLFRRQRS